VEDGDSSGTSMSGRPHRRACSTRRLRPNVIKLTIQIMEVNILWFIKDIIFLKIRKKA
jgi:hypothetical protein